MLRSVKLFGHIIFQEGIASDPEEVEAIVNVLQTDLMESDGITLSFRGKVVCYEHFFENCSVLARPLFALIGG